MERVRRPLFVLLAVVVALFLMWTASVTNAIRTNKGLRTLSIIADFKIDIPAVLQLSSRGHKNEIALKLAEIKLLKNTKAKSTDMEQG